MVAARSQAPTRYHTSTRTRFLGETSQEMPAKSMALKANASMVAQRSLELAEGDVALALAGYNGGHGQISRPSNLWPAETRRYVRWGTEILTDVQQGTLPSPGVNSWLQAGGASLCRRAAVAQASG